MLGGPPDHHLPGGNVKREAKRESGSWAAAGSSSRQVSLMVSFTCGEVTRHVNGSDTIHVFVEEMEQRAVET